MTDKHVQFDSPTAAMKRALEMAHQGIGRVEPNPQVGAVITDDDLNLLADGAHLAFGGPHAEVNAIKNANVPLSGSTLFVTLEPCAHYGKTPPCADAVIAAGIKRVYIGTADPATHTHGAGIERLKGAGIEVHVGLCESEAKRLIAPFTKLHCLGQPYVIAKWAMTADGKIASRTGSSKWISSESSRQIVHRLRGRVDGILTGIGTVLADDPLLTPRPAGTRVPVRIVLDSQARLPVHSQLINSIDQGPVLVFVANEADSARVSRLRDLGAEVVQISPDTSTGQLDVTQILYELGRRQMTNLMVEGGPRILGAFFDARAIDEVHCFIAPKLIGGSAALPPIGGIGWETMDSAVDLQDPKMESAGSDIYLTGWIKQQAHSAAE